MCVVLKFLGYNVGMRHKWLNNEHNKSLILFFNGWGMDEDVVKHLLFGEFDVLMFYDYNCLDTDFNFDMLDKYKNIYLVAWSMGVMIGSILGVKIKNLTYSVAINGTLHPIDENYGINPRIYDLTIRGFNENGSKKFVSKMFNTDTTLMLSRSLQNQKSELAALRNYTANLDFKYDKVFISDNDNIIPTKNQCAFWNMTPNIKSGHCPFLEFGEWSEII